MTPIPDPFTVRERRSGFSLIELSIAVTIFALALLSTGLTLLHGVRSQDESASLSDCLRSVRDVFAEIQQIANAPEDLSALKGIGSIHALYNGHTRAVPELPSGTMTITVHGNEALVPIDLGGPQDLNFDGDAADDLGGVSAGTDLQLILLEVTVSFTDDRGTIARTFHRRIAQTTD